MMATQPWHEPDIRCMQCMRDLWVPELEQGTCRLMMPGTGWIGCICQHIWKRLGPPGPRCFGPRIMNEPPPYPGFQLPRGVRTYNGSTKPEDWLDDYVTAVYIASGNKRWAVRLIPQMLEGPARLWLNNLPEGSINTWPEFQKAFHSNFSSTYKRPNRPHVLAAVRQRDNETDREYLTRWCNIRNTCEGIQESVAIGWFADGCRHGSVLWQRLQREMPATMAEMINIADQYALGDPTQPSPQAVDPNRVFQPNERRNDFRNKRQHDRPDYRYGPVQVNAVGADQPGAGSSQRQRVEGKKPWEKKPWDGQKKPWQDKPKYTLDICLDGPCSFHTVDQRRPANHITRDCSWYHRIVKEGTGAGLPPPPPLTGANTVPIQVAPALNANRPQQPVQVAPAYVENRPQQYPGDYNGMNNQERGGDPAQAGRNDYREHHMTYVVFVTEPTDKQSQRRRMMEVNAVVPAVPRFMPWSEQDLIWNRRDHPRVMPNPGGYALVLDPTLVGPTHNVRFSKVLIDHGSALNILYKDSLIKLGFTENMLNPSNTTFHGIVPGVSCAPIGSIWIDVMFGTKENCRTEALEFEVVDLESPYHALLGRPMLAKFMASTHIAYLQMKMPGPNGTITIKGDYKRSLLCATAGSALAESMVIASEKKKIQEVVAMAQSAQLGMPGLGNPNGNVAFQASKETKKVNLDDDFPERNAIIGAGMDPK